MSNVLGIVQERMKYRGCRVIAYAHDRAGPWRVRVEGEEVNTATAIGEYPTAEHALSIGKAMIDGVKEPARVCSLADIDRVRRENANRRI